MVTSSKIQFSQPKAPATTRPVPFLLSPFPKEPKRITPERREKNVFSLARDLEGKHKHRKQEKKKTTNSHPERLDAFYEKHLIFTPTPPQEEIQSVSSSKALATLVDSLIDKLHYVIDKGISKTHIFIGNTPSHPIHQTEITITHYDTAPHSFYIDFLAPESSCQFITSHLIALSHNLEHSMPKCLFSLSKPLLNTYTSKVGKKESSSKLEKNKKNPFSDENILY